jgi:response regulator RpfG family c-di-GMP phosphodiesterase
MHREVEQLSIVEAMLIIGEDIARSTDVSYIFDPDSAKRVTRYALAIAKEFRMSESERQALRYAALLKDLGLVLSAHDMVEQIGVPTVEEAMEIRARFNPMWKALSTIPFLSSALVIIQYRYERYDGTGSRFGARGTDIPLGARILAVAGAFDAMVSGLSSEGMLALKAALQRITDDSGLRFDPDVINAFLRVWRRKELHLVLRNFDKEYKQHE